MVFLDMVIITSIHEVKYVIEYCLLPMNLFILLRSLCLQYYYGPITCKKSVG